MENVLLMDTSIASLNKGDEIIMRCIREELKYYTNNRFQLTLPTHISSFNFFQVLRNSLRVQTYKNCNRKFVCGSNLLVKNLFTHFPQWNINFLNYSVLKGCILMGVGAGIGERTNLYTKFLYKKLLNKNLYHSVRDERSKLFMENELNLKAINTGCPTMWMFTPEFCKLIPTKKSNSVVFTLTAKESKDMRDQKLIDILLDKYSKIYYWVQGINDFQYIKQFKNIEKVEIINATVEDYENVLKQDNLDYIGTRLHAGIYAMRYKKRAIIIAIDERAREINKCNNLNCIEKDELDKLPDLIDSEFETHIKMPFEQIEKWKTQFI